MDYVTYLMIAVLCGFTALCGFGLVMAIKQVKKHTRDPLVPPRPSQDITKFEHQESANSYGGKIENGLTASALFSTTH